MRRYYLQSGLWMGVLTVLILGGLYVAADLNATDSPSNTLNIEGRFWSDTGASFASDKISGRSAKIVAGSNANATVTIDLIANGGAGNQTDDGVHSGVVSGQGTKIAVEVFARGVTTSLVGVQIEFGFNASVLTFDKAENSAFPLVIIEATGASLAGYPPVTLPASGFIARAEFTTAVDVTGREFSIGIKQVTLAESAASSDTITTRNAISFNAALSHDFDGDGTVGFSDFLAFAGQYGAQTRDGRYQAQYDLDVNGVINFSDFLMFASSYGQQVPPSGGSATPVDIPDANLRAVIADSLGKAHNASITRAEMATLIRIVAPNKGIRSLTGLEHATNLTSLSLGRMRVNDEWVNSNDISNLSPLSNLINLTYLDLTSNSISDISALSNLINLTGLHLGSNSISDISALSNLTNLIGLNLWGNSISDISALSRLTNLTYLSLAQNSISDISVLSNLTNLEILYLWGNSISDISALSRLTNLTELYIGSNSISDISVLSNLTNLTRLYLDRNNISDVSALSNLSNLQWLNLSGNAGLSGPLPGSFTGLGSLTRLYVDGTGLCAPTDAAFQTWLQGIANKRGVVNCSTTPGSGPPGSGDRDVLVALYNATNGPNWRNNTNWLSAAPLNQWHGVTTDANGRVTRLDLSGNGLSGTLPSELGRLTNLEYLYLFTNQLSGSLPSSLGNLTNLKELDLRYNQLSGSLPSSLGNLTNLQRLWLGGNQLLRAGGRCIPDVATGDQEQIGRCQLRGRWRNAKDVLDGRRDEQDPACQPGR